MKFRQVVRRLTGLGTLIGGVQWEYRKGDAGIAHDVISFLEDRRVLYNPDDLEMVPHCIGSVLDIRRFLTQELAELDPKSELAESLKAMRASCRKFLDEAGMHSYFPAFAVHLGELRGVFGIHIAQIAAKYHVDVEDQLAVILPPEVDKSDADDEDFPPRRHRHGPR